MDLLGANRLGIAVWRGGRETFLMWCDTNKPPVDSLATGTDSVKIGC